MQVLDTASIVRTKMKNASFYYPVDTRVFMYRNELKNVTHEFILISPAVASMSYLDEKWAVSCYSFVEWAVSGMSRELLLICGMGSELLLICGMFVQNNTQNIYIVLVYLFLQVFQSSSIGANIS